MPARTRPGAFLEQDITTTGYIICFKSLQMFPLENFHLWNCQVRCLWGETWLQGIGSCHDKSCRTKQQENFDFERKHFVLGGFRALALVPNATGIGKTQSGHTDPGKSCWFVLNAVLSMNHSGNIPKALFYDHIITYTFGVQTLQRIFWATSFIHFFSFYRSQMECTEWPL